MLNWFRRDRKKDARDALEETLGDFRLPSFPRAASETLSLLRDPEAPLRRVAEAIERDPALSVRVLSLTNSGANALRFPTRDVHHAASLLGRAELERLVLAVAVQRSMPKRPYPGFAWAAYWEAAYRRAAIAAELADVLAPAMRSESFTAALLADMAIPLMARAHRKRYPPVHQAWARGEGDLVELERQTFGVDHAITAGWLADYWSFPPTLRDAVDSHHDGTNEASPMGLVSPIREGHERPDVTQLMQETLSDHDLPTEPLMEAVEHGLDRASELAAAMR